MDVRIKVEQGAIVVKLRNAARQAFGSENATPRTVPALVGLNEFIHLVQLVRGRRAFYICSELFKNCTCGSPELDLADQAKVSMIGEL